MPAQGRIGSRVDLSSWAVVERRMQEGRFYAQVIHNRIRAHRSAAIPTIP
jgi:hypothetical protein